MNLNIRTFLLSAILSVAADLGILALFLPLSLGFRIEIVVQILFWTSLGAFGALLWLSFLQNFTGHPERYFLFSSASVFASSFIPIYLHLGIIHMFPPEYTLAIIEAISLMHVADSIIIVSILYRLRLQ